MEVSEGLWSVVVPVRPWWLAPEPLGPRREELVRAMALDVLDVVAATASIRYGVVVTGEPEAAAFAKRLGMDVLEDRPLLSATPGVDATQRAVRWIGGRRPRLPVAVVPADLPALTSESLTEALVRLGAVGEACVPDVHGRGITLRATRVPASFVAASGTDAVGAVSRLGVRGVTAVEPGVRSDVDELAALQRIAGALGPRTSVVVRDMVGAPHAGVTSRLG